MVAIPLAQYSDDAPFAIRVRLVWLGYGIDHPARLGKNLYARAIAQKRKRPPRNPKRPCGSPIPV